MPRPDGSRALLLSCEHARNSLPPELRRLFKGRQRLLDSHRGWDEGALEIARGLRPRLRAPLLEGRYSRLVIDLNRSSQHRGAFSEFTRKLPRAEKENLLEKIYHPFRQNALALVRGKSHTLHLSVHSFVPVLNGKERNCEIGILYDPRRLSEKTAARRLKSSFKKHFPLFRVRMNYPYRGMCDGHTSALRLVFPEKQYTGIEIEFNQRLLRALKNKKPLLEFLAQALKQASAPERPS